MARGGGGRSGGGSRGGGGFSSGGSRSSRGFSSSSGRGSRSGFGSGSRGGMGSGSSRPGGFGPSMSGGSRPGGFGGSRSGGSRPGGFGPSMGGFGPMMGGGHRPRSSRPVFVSTPGSGRRVSGGGGCGSGIGTLLIVVVFLIIFFSLMSKGNSDNYQDTTDIVSTVERDPLPSGSVNETGYYTDNLGWINLSTKLTSGMKSFYKETGVQPYLYLASEKEVLTYDSLQTFAETKYDELFTDEAHFLFVYTEDKYEEWEIWFVVGTQAASVIDTEAQEIIFQFFSRYYYIDESELGNEEFFSRVFEESAELMMKHVTNGFDVAKVALMIVGGVAVIGIIVYGVMKNRKIQLEREKEKNEFTEKMMNVPLETFGEAEADKELEELMKKYQENQSK